MSDEGKVSLSFEYLFGNLQQTLESGFNRLDRSVEEVRKQLEQKASLEQVAAVKREVADLEVRHEKRLVKVEEAMIGSEAGAKIKSKGIAWLGSLLVCLIGYLFYIAATGGFH